MRIGMKITYKTRSIQELWRDKIPPENIIKRIGYNNYNYGLGIYRYEHNLNYAIYKTKNFLVHFYVCENKWVYIPDTTVYRFIYFIIENNLIKKTMPEAFILYRLTVNDEGLDKQIKTALSMEERKERKERNNGGTGGFK